MKTLIYAAMLVGAVITFSGCADSEPRHTSTTTTTEESQVQQPAAQTTTVETQKTY